MKGIFKERKDGTAVYIATFPADEYSYLEARAEYDRIRTTVIEDPIEGYKEVLYKTIEGKKFIMEIVNDDRYENSDELHLLNDNGEGISGNSNPNIKCYHGWRGTWNTRATYGCGLREVKSTTLKEGDKTHVSKIRIVFGKDLAKDRE